MLISSFIFDERQREYFNIVFKLMLLPNVEVQVKTERVTLHFYIYYTSILKTLIKWFHNSGMFERINKTFRRKNKFLQGYE